MSVNFLELEITGFCQLACRHCYADSGTHGTHGAMTSADWRSVIDQAAAIGVSWIQFIGGEPTLHPEFGELLRYAVSAGRRVEVYTNLVHVRPEWWAMFSHPSVWLATRYYSDTVAGHEEVTGRHGSHARTRANIAEAVRRAIPLRVGIIDVLDRQRVAEARADLENLGVTDIGTDRLRGVGRGARATPKASELCGHCGRSKAAISPDGEVWPCVLARWMAPVGNAKHERLATILRGPKMADHVAAIPAPAAVCNPNCKPSQGDGNDCAPAESEACNPKY